MAAYAVHGADDCLCRPDNALLLAKAWDARPVDVPGGGGGGMRLKLVPGARHSMYEPGLIDGVVLALDEIAAAAGK